jgi:WD40 repeat protein
MEESSYSLGDVDDPQGLLTIDSVTLDIKGSYIAVVFEQGNIQVYQLTGEPNFGLSKRSELGERTIKGNETTRALGFDDTRSWLANLRDGDLSIWDLRFGRNKLYLSMPVSRGKLLAFDPLGKFLLVGTENTIQILDIHSKKLLEEYETPGISSLMFSPDGRMIIWGDKHGVIHLWGALQK